MKRLTIFALAGWLVLAQISRANVPTGFSWINLESDKTTMAVVRRALHATSISAIREVGVEDGFALVMTVSREDGAPTPDYDQWSIYNISLTTGASKQLVSGYGVKLLDWIGPTHHELAISYFDCWECEAATLFTTLRFTKGNGWTARWPNKTNDSRFPQPGAVASITDFGDPYDDNDVEQIFAVVKQPNNGFAVGWWLTSRNSKTAKIDNDVERYAIDPATQQERVEKLSGLAALNWEREICASSNVVVQPAIGQESNACRRVLKTATARSLISK